jgi:hypothetical protein
MHYAIELLTMNRWVWFSLCAILGLLMLVCGLLVPMHLRAVDAGVIERAGRNTPSLIDEGMTLARKQQLGAARLLSQAADALPRKSICSPHNIPNCFTGMTRRRGGRNYSRPNRSMPRLHSRNLC